MNILFLGLLWAGFAGCAGGGESDVVGESVPFSVRPTISPSVSGQIDGDISTRAKIDGVFPMQSRVGLSIRGSSAIGPGYDHFMAQSDGATWFYWPNGANAGSMLAGFASWGNITICGYHPYNAAATDLTLIPFLIASPTETPGEARSTSLGAVTDHMVAGTKTKDMAVATGVPVTLEFRHLMTSVELRVLKSYPRTPILKLEGVTWEITAGSRQFTIDGTYNARNPDMAVMSNNITPGATATKMIIACPDSPDITYYTTDPIPLVIIPELRQTTGANGADDATVRLSFRFADQNGYHYVFEEAASSGGDPFVSFKLSDIANGADDRGLLAGRTYSVTAILGTYTKFTAPTGPTVVYKPLEDGSSTYIDI